MPLVSVIVPTHNRPEMLAEALASVRQQTVSPYEIIVVSNGESAANRILSEASAVRYGAYFFSLDEGNLPAARNFAIKLARGEWIAFLDDDDIWLPNKLERQLQAARATGADMVASDYIEFYPDGREAIGGRRVPPSWTYHKAICHQKWGVPPSAVIVRSDVLHKVGLFDAKQRFGEDGDLWRRISWRHSIYQVDEPLIRYRKHSLTMTQDRRSTNRYDLKHFLKMLRDTPPDLKWAVPSAFTLMRRWALRMIMPKFLRQPRKFLQSLRR